ncbi:hypothetical protein Lal_00032149 [Lupinus albus]|nr:hypothetical protein Lal_00032149 [Lupinus albus]
MDITPLELIETLAWAQERTLLANLIRWRDKSMALSIVQARLVGLAHFSVDLPYVVLVRPLWCRLALRGIDSPYVV